MGIVRAGQNGKDKDSRGTKCRQHLAAGANPQASVPGETIAVKRRQQGVFAVNGSAVAISRLGMDVFCFLRACARSYLLSSLRD